MSVLNARDPKLDRGRLRIVIVTIVINVVAVLLLTFAPWSDWRIGAALNFVDNCLLVGFILVRRDALLGRFIIFGLAVGLTELAADAWLVDYTGTLDYSIGGGPMIWRSPLWMPLAWKVVAVQFGYSGCDCGPLRQDRSGDDWVVRCDKHSVLRRNGAPDSLAEIQWLQNDFVYAWVHHSWGVRHRGGVGIAGPDGPSQFLARRRRRGHRWWSINIWLLRSGFSDYRSIS
jgi:hypothetical protein